MTAQDRKPRRVADIIRDIVAERVEYLRVPGLLRRWEIADVVEAGDELRVEDAGTCEDGTPLFFVFRREREAEEAS